MNKNLLPSVSVGVRENTEQREPTGLAKGQLWKTEEGYFRIVGLDEKLVEYRLMKHKNQAVAWKRFMRGEALQAYLRGAQATLVAESDVAGDSCLNDGRNGQEARAKDVQEAATEAALTPKPGGLASALA